MAERSYLSLASAARQPENRCLKRKLSIRHAHGRAAQTRKGRHSICCLSFVSNVVKGGNVTTISGWRVTTTDSGGCFVY
jgi:hypothetical protein